MDLVTPGELASYLRRGTLDSGSAEMACRLATGWLYGHTGGWSTWPPLPVPHDLWAWALELAALAYDNPTTRERVTLSRMTVVWGAEAAARWQRIIDAASERYPPTAPATSAPQGCFPDAVSYPDPAYVGTCSE